MQYPYHDYLRVMRTAAWMWIAYLASMAVIDLAIYSGKSGAPILWYYSMIVLPAVIFIGLAYSPWLKKSAGIIPALMVTLISIAPILMNYGFNLRLPPAPLSNLEGMALRQLPIMMIGLVLVAWQYRLLITILYSVSVNLFELVVVLTINRLADPRFMSFFFIILIRMMCFLVVGVFINYLITYLRAQQESLRIANQQIRHHASIMESLSVSRERNRLSRELHDTVVHTLSGLSVQLETIRAYWDVDPETARNQLDQSLETTHSGLQETRRALKALRASPLDDLGLINALQRLVENAGARGKLQVEIGLPFQEIILSPDVEQGIYRIAQEAVENVVHHANAHQLAVSLTKQSSEITMLIRDDGIGFKPETTALQQIPGHFGLEGMRERAQLIGGELTIISQANCGTTIRLAVKEII